MNPLDLTIVDRNAAALAVAMVTSHTIATGKLDAA